MNADLRRIRKEDCLFHSGNNGNDYDQGWTGYDTFVRDGYNSIDEEIGN